MLNIDVDAPLPYKEATMQDIRAAIPRGVAAVAQVLLGDFSAKAARHIKLEISPGAEFAAAGQG
jgi:hypothetical protein